MRARRLTVVFGVAVAWLLFAGSAAAQELSDRQLRQRITWAISQVRNRMQADSAELGHLQLVLAELNARIVRDSLRADSAIVVPDPIPGDTVTPPDTAAPPVVDSASVRATYSVVDRSATEHRLRVAVAASGAGGSVTYTAQGGGLTPSRQPTLTRALLAGGVDDAVWYVPVGAPARLIVNVGPAADTIDYDPGAAVPVDSLPPPPIDTVPPSPDSAVSRTLDVVANEWHGGWEILVTLPGGGTVTAKRIAGGLLDGRDSVSISAPDGQRIELVGVWALLPGTNTVEITAHGASPVRLTRVLANPPPDSAPPDTTTVPVPTPPPAGQFTPAALFPLLGPLVARGTGNVAEASVLDAIFAAREQQAWADWQQSGDVIRAHHYDALVSRMQWAIRNGLGTGDPIIQRGRDIVLAYLNNYAARNSYNTPVQNSTGLAGEEILYRLEGNTQARDHIHAYAARQTSDQYNYLSLQNPASGARIPAIALQAISAAHRLGLPYKGSAAHGSWVNAGRWVVGRVGPAIQSDGTIISPSNGAGTETFFMNAMLASELLRWHGYVEPQPQWVALAGRIMDHLIVEHARRGAPCLPYLSSGNGCSADLAGYFVWPALVLWQETGDAKYRAFALANLAAARGVFAGVKQFNQVFSTGVQNAEALLSGVRWK